MQPGALRILAAVLLAVPTGSCRSGGFRGPDPTDPTACLSVHALSPEHEDLGLSASGEAWCSTLKVVPRIDTSNLGLVIGRGRVIRVQPGTIRLPVQVEVQHEYHTVGGCATEGACCLLMLPMALVFELLFGSGASSGMDPVDAGTSCNYSFQASTPVTVLVEAGHRYEITAHPTQIGRGEVLLVVRDRSVVGRRIAGDPWARDWVREASDQVFRLRGSWKGDFDDGQRR